MERPDGVSDATEFRHSVVIRLRATLARYPSDPMVTGLVGEITVDGDVTSRARGQAGKSRR